MEKKTKQGYPLISGKKKSGPKTVKAGGGSALGRMFKRGQRAITGYLSGQGGAGKWMRPK